MLNYAKVRNQVLFFDDSKPTNTNTAYCKALILADGNPDLIHFYTVPFHAGPWDRAGIMGHRHRVAIMADIHAAPDSITKERCLTELTALNLMYYIAGRSEMPHEIMEVVAA